jgi:general stress protein YciG
MQRSKQGFAAIDPERRREIASMGGRAAHESGNARKWTAEEASAAGKKGGCRDRERMRELGRRGGLAKRGKRHAKSAETAAQTARCRDGCRVPEVCRTCWMRAPFELRQAVADARPGTLVMRVAARKLRAWLRDNPAPDGLALVSEQCASRNKGHRAVRKASEQPTMNHYLQEAARDFLKRAEKHRTERIENLKTFRRQAEETLARAKKECEEQPKNIARYSAEIAKLEAMTGVDIARQMLGDAAPVKTLHAEEDTAALAQVGRAGGANDDPLIIGDTPQVETTPLAQPTTKPPEDDDPVERAFWRFCMLIDKTQRIPRVKAGYLEGPYTQRDAFKIAVRSTIVGAEKPEPPALLGLRGLPVGTTLEAMGEITLANGVRIQAGQRFVIATQEGFHSQSEYPVRLERENERGNMMQGWCRAEQPARVVEVPR